MQHRLHMANLWNCSDPFDSPPFLFGGSLRVTKRAPTCVIPSSARDLYGNIDNICIEILRLHFVSLRMTMRKPLFNNQIARGKMTLLPKRTQFAENFRLNSERVNAPRSYNGEHMVRGAERKTNAEPRKVAANIRLSLKSRKKVLSLSKLFS